MLKELDKERFIKQAKEMSYECFNLALDPAQWYDNFSPPFGIVESEKLLSMCQVLTLDKDTLDQYIMFNGLDMTSYNNHIKLCFNLMSIKKGKGKELLFELRDNFKTDIYIITENSKLAEYYSDIGFKTLCRRDGQELMVLPFK